MPELAEILLKITGDSDEAQRDLKEFAGEVKAVDELDAEVTIDVVTKQAERDLRTIRRQLERVDVATARPEVQAQTAKALIDLGVLEAELARIDKLDPKIDIDVRRGLLETVIGGFSELRNVAEKVSEPIEEAGKVAAKTGIQFGSAGINLGNLTIRIGPAVVAAGILAVALSIVGVILVGLGALVAAFVASLAAATLALGALVTAFGGAAAAAGIFAVAVALAFEKGGETVKLFKDELRDLKRVFATSLKPGVDAFLTGLLPAMNSVEDLLRTLSPAFERLGGALARAGRVLARGFEAMGPGFAELITAASKLAVPFARVLVPFMKILLNIANAAMPFLISGMKSVARLFRGWAKGTSDSEKLGGVIGGLVSHLAEWFRLGKAVVRIFLAFFGAIAGDGKKLVGSLADGAEQLATWIENNPEEIREFFRKTLPMIVSFLEVVLKLVVAFLQFTEAVAPALTRFFNYLSGELDELIAWFRDMGRIFADVAGWIGRANADATEWISQAWKDVKQSLEESWGWIKRAASNTAEWVTNAWANTRDWLKAAWANMKGWVSQAWRDVRDAIVSPFRTAIQWIKTAWVNAREWLKTAWQNTRDKAKEWWDKIKRAITQPIRDALTRVKELAGDFYDAGRALMTSLWDGLKSRWEDVKGWFGDRLGDLKGLLPGSEPSDPASPLRGLDKRGAAIMDNVARGMRGAAPRFDRAVASAVGGIRASVTLPGPVAAGGLAASGGPNGMVIEHQAVHLPQPPSGVMDARYAALQFSRELKRRAARVPDGARTGRRAARARGAPRLRGRRLLGGGGDVRLPALPDELHQPEPDHRPQRAR